MEKQSILLSKVQADQTHNHRGPKISCIVDRIMKNHCFIVKAFDACHKADT